MKTQSRISHLNRPESEVEAIAKAIQACGAKTVYDATVLAFAGNKTNLVDMIGEYRTLATVHAAQVAAFDLLTKTEKKEDRISATQKLSMYARSMGSRGGRAGTDAQNEARAANGRRGGRPKKTA